MRQIEKGDTFKPHHNSCTYAVDNKHFPVQKDYPETVAVVEYSSEEDEEVDHLVHGVMKNGAPDFGPLHIQSLQEIGGVVPPLRPFEIKEDLLKVLGILFPMSGPASKRQLADWLESTRAPKMVLKGDHHCEHSEFFTNAFF